MPASKSTAGVVPAVDIDPQAALRVDCYVRSTVPTAIAETIDAIVERLQHLCDTGCIADYQISHWPPERHAVDETADERAPPRDELVAEFERWAEQHDSTIELAFRRQERPSSLLGIGSDEPRERVQVPLVALALYEDEEKPDIETETETLRGVIPYTDHSQTGDQRTYTVTEWLTALETKGRAHFTRTSQHEQPTPPEGQQ